MSDRGHPSISVSIPDPNLRVFLREQADSFFGGKIAPYVVSLIEMDRESGLTRRAFLRRLTAGTESESDADLIAVAS